MAATLPQGANRYPPETSSSEGGAVARCAMREIAAGLAVPVDRARAEQPGLIDRDRKRFMWTLTADDEAAQRCFLGACRAGAVGWDGVLGLAVSTPDAIVARRALASTVIAQPHDLDADRSVPLLLALLDREDVIVSSLALDVLAQVATHRMSEATRAAIADRAVAAWALRDDASWRDREESSGGNGAHTSLSRRGMLAKLIAIGASTGHRRFVDALLASAPAPAVPQHGDWPSANDEELVLECLACAALHADAPTASRLHARFAPAVAKADAPCSSWTTAAERIVAAVFPVVPLELCARYAPLVQREEWNARCRAACAAHGGVADERARLLLLPLAREDDRDVMLLAPQQVVAALRSGAANRARAIAILDGSAAGPRWQPQVFGRPSRARVAHLSASHWHAVLPAIAELPVAEQAALLAQIADELRSLGIDVSPLLERVSASTAEQHIATGLAVSPPDADSVRGGVVTRGDEIAAEQFHEASRVGPGGIDAVLHLAASTPHAYVARRALHGLAQTRLPDRTVPLLLRLVDREDEVIACLALERLANTIAERPLSAATKRALVDAALAHWPADDRRLQWPQTQYCLGCGSPRAHLFLNGPKRDVPSELIALAARSGDVAILDRLMPRAVPDFWFVRCWLRDAAPYVPAETARYMQRWSLPDFAIYARDPRAAGASVLAAVDGLARLLASVPDDVLPSYEPMLRNDAFNRKAREHAARCGVFPEARLRLLLLPLDREYDGDLVLRAPEFVTAAIRGSDEERDRMVNLLARRTDFRDKPSIGRELNTAAHWHAVLPAIAELPIPRRKLVIEVRERELRELGIDVDEWLRDQELRQLGIDVNSRVRRR